MNRLNEIAMFSTYAKNQNSHLLQYYIANVNLEVMEKK